MASWLRLQVTTGLKHTSCRGWCPWIHPPAQLRLDGLWIGFSRVDHRWFDQRALTEALQEGIPSHGRTISLLFFFCNDCETRDRTHSTLPDLRLSNASRRSTSAGARSPFADCYSYSSSRSASLTRLSTTEWNSMSNHRLNVRRSRLLGQSLLSVHQLASCSSKIQPK